MMLVVANKPGAFHGLPQPSCVEYPDVPAFNLMIGGTQFPADPFGEVTRYAYGRPAAGFQYAADLTDHGLIFVNMLKHF